MKTNKIYLFIHCTKKIRLILVATRVLDKLRCRPTQNRRGSFKDTEGNQEAINEMKAK